MSAFNKNGWVSLAEICDERQLVTDVETGKKVLRAAYFSSMNAMIEGAYQLPVFLKSCIKTVRFTAVFLRKHFILI